MFLCLVISLSTALEAVSSLMSHVSVPKVVHVPRFSSTHCSSSSDQMTEAPDHCYDVCVVGGGLGGLALAVALEQLGLDWQLCEAAEELR